MTTNCIFICSKRIEIFVVFNAETGLFEGDKTSRVNCHLEK